MGNFGRDEGVQKARRIEDLIGELKELVLQRHSVACSIDELRREKQRLEENEEKIRDELHALMDELGARKFFASTGPATLKITNGPWSVMVTDPAALPADYMKVEVKPKLREIKAAIANGAEVPGVAKRNPKPILRIEWHANNEGE